ncbi:MAG: DUF6851 domain-containing protein [Pleurocapsa sp.]
MTELTLDPTTQLLTVEDSTPTISVIWDQAAQQAVINTAVGPTIASRAYGIVHTAMYDAWAAYDPVAISTQLSEEFQQPEAEITDTNKQEAMSYAAYQVLVDLFPGEAELFEQLMVELGYDPNNHTLDPNTPAGIGNLAAQVLLEYRHDDGSNQLGDNPNGILGTPYSDITDYEPVNPAGNTIDIEHWTPEFIPIDDSSGSVQQFLTPHWGDVTPFALESGDALRPVAPEPFLLVEGEVDLEAQTIILEDGLVLDIDRSLIGTVINPEFINQAEQVIEYSTKLTDKQRLIAEFWEDGESTSFPPGTWMTFGQFVSAENEHTLDEDAQLFFGLGNAVFDAGIATWESKTYYDYVRPVRAIRELGELGLIGEYNAELGGYAIKAWQPGVGTQTILATDFITYQTPGGHPSPPFSEYTSGHSAFSAAGAEYLKLFTGSDEFGASITFGVGESRFEPGLTPQEPVVLEWATFSEAADEAGISRLYGGIHFEDGDLNARLLGEQVGQAVYEETQFYINGGVDLEPNMAENFEVFFGTIEEDLIEVNGTGQLIFAGAGNDFVDATINSEGNNRIYAGSGDDILILGARDLFVGGEGNDQFFASVYGDNRLVGGDGEDQFWVAVAEFPETPNIIVDFVSGEDAIGLIGLGIGFEDLNLNQDGSDTLIETAGITLAKLLNIEAISLSANDFTFV